MDVPETGRITRVEDLPFKGRTRFVVFQVYNRFFVELFPDKKQSSNQATSPSEPQLVDPNPLSSNLSDTFPEQNNFAALGQNRELLNDSQPLTTEPSIEDSQSSRSQSLQENEQKSRNRSQRNSTSRTRKKMKKVDVLVITALPMERDAFMKSRDLPGEPDSDWEKCEKLERSYYVRSFYRNDETLFTVAIATPTQIGEQAATVTATRLADQLKPKCLAMTGICAGNRDAGVVLGDVIVADRVFDFDFGKLKAYYNRRGVRQAEILHDTKTWNLNSNWVEKINNLSQNPIGWENSMSIQKPKSYASQELWLLHKLDEYQSNPSTCVHPRLHIDRERECPSWKKVVDRLLEKRCLVFSEDGSDLEFTSEGKAFLNKDRLLGREEEPKVPRVHPGPIGTGKQVQRDPQLFKALEKIQCRTFGVEMEGNAIGAVAWELQIPWMIVAKGVSDYGDYDKDDQFHEYAAEASARFLIAFLKEHLPPK